MPNFRKTISSGWGNFPKKHCLSFRPEKRSDVESCIKNISDQNSSSIIARGGGCSYGDASVTKDYYLDSSRLKKILKFDIEKGIIECEGGTTLEEIIDVIIPKGWILPVIPGTKFATIGGAFACNIHGKNHYNKGDIAKHIQKIILRCANNEIVECSPKVNKELLSATAGGMGMTGFIEEITIKLKPINSISLKSTSETVENISEMVNCFYKNKESSDYMIGWIDHSAIEKNIGKGIFEKANHISKKEGGVDTLEYKKPKQKITIPFYFPHWILNKYTMKIYNKLRFKKYTQIPIEEIVDFDSFFHPLDKIKNWNKLYGKNGFIQYQCIIPETERTVDNIKKLLSMIKDKGLFSYLAIIKYHENNDYKNPTLSFTEKGFSIALDFPNNEKVHQLINELNEYIVNINGKVYLAKDALLTRKQFETMYSDNISEWKDIVMSCDPENIFSSEMSKRLGFKDK